MSLRFSLRLVALGGLLLAGVLPLRANGANGAKAKKDGAKDAKEVVQTAMQAELAADKNDHTRWRYRDAKKDGVDTVSIVVETKDGSVRRVIMRNGQPLSEAEARAEDERVQRFIHDPEKLAKQRRDGAQDGKNAEDLLKMLPEAFTWKIVSDDEQKCTLHFDPNPNFNPPDMKGRVLGTMAGTLVVSKPENRIETISGKLTQDVTIGWGLLGRLHEGGTFRVERRQVAPGLWQIVETHVHIEGKALFFKTIGEQQDEVQTEFTQVPAGTTLEQAVEMSKPTYGAAVGNGTHR
jgi:hypothetical protein